MDLEKLDLNKGLNAKFEINQKPEITTRNKPIAEYTTADYEEMNKSGMTHDEIMEVLEITYQKGENIKDIISEVKMYSSDNRIDSKKMKEKLAKRPDKVVEIPDSDEVKRIKESMKKNKRKSCKDKKMRAEKNNSIEPQAGMETPVVSQ
jgi:hypothetical protein